MTSPRDPNEYKKSTSSSSENVIEMKESPKRRGEIYLSCSAYKNVFVTHEKNRSTYLTILLCYGKYVPL